jgi:hypothetical protein
VKALDQSRDSTPHSAGLLNGSSIGLLWLQESRGRIFLSTDSSYEAASGQRALELVCSRR